MEQETFSRDVQAVRVKCHVQIHELENKLNECLIPRVRNWIDGQDPFYAEHDWTQNTKAFEN